MEVRPGTGSPPPNVTIFHKTITNLGLVRAAQDQIDGARKARGFDRCSLIRPGYHVYRFLFRYR